MKESLTEKEKELTKIVRDEWLNLFKDESPATMNKKVVREGVEWMYDLAGLDKPIIILYGLL